MTGPEGERHHGYWRVTSVDPPRSVEFTDGFADEDGTPIADMPITTTRMQLTELPFRNGERVTHKHRPCHRVELAGRLSNPRLLGELRSLL